MLSNSSARPRIVQRIQRWGALAWFLSATAALAVSPTPDVIQQLKKDGHWDSYLALYHAALARGVDAPVARSQGELARLAAGSAVFNFHIPCILVDFSDNPASGGKVSATPAMFDSLLFSTGRNPTGSMKEYYSEVSYGQMNVIGTVVGWYRMPNPYSYYINHEMGLGASPNNAQRLVEHAIAAASADLDYSQFDNDNNDWVDGVMVVVPGPGFEETGDSTLIQSHRFHTTVIANYNGKLIADYTIQPEETVVKGGGLNAIGVFCHEWGHILGLTDLYDLDGNSRGLGNWSLMATGNYNHDSRVPAHPDAWSRIALGFVTPEQLAQPTTNLASVAFPAVETSPTIYKLWTGGTIGPTSQYFLVENRQQTGFDQYLPGAGLLVYHVDPVASDNTGQWVPGLDPPSAPHYKVALEQADGTFNLEFNNNSGDAGDPYFSDSAGFDDLSWPSSRNYLGQSTQVAVWNISAASMNMTANIDVVYSRPYLKTLNYALSDPAGNGNGVAEPGETVRLTFDLTDLWQAASNIDVTVQAPGSGLIFIDSTFHAASVGSGETINNSLDPITFSVPATYRSRVVPFTMAVTAGGGVSRWTYTTRHEIGRPHVLVVDDDRGKLLEGRLNATLDSLNQVHRAWDVSAKGTPPAETLLTYPIVIWQTGDSNRVSPTHASALAIKSYLDGNGHLFLTGQDIVQNWNASSDSAFLFDYFGVRYAGLETFAVASGVASDPVGDGMQINGAGQDGANNQKSADRLDLVSGSPAIVCYNYRFTPSLPNAAVHIERNGYRAVVFGFGFETISSTQYYAPYYFNTRAQVLAPILNWLNGDATTGIFDDPTDGSGAAGVPSSFELLQNYPNPFNAGTVIPFVVAGAQSQAVRLQIIDILGRQVRVLLDGTAEPGRHEIAWDGADTHGRYAASGVYFYRLSVNGRASTARRMVLIK